MNREAGQQQDLRVRLHAEYIRGLYEDVAGHGVNHDKWGRVPAALGNYWNSAKMSSELAYRRGTDKKIRNDWPIGMEVSAFSSIMRHGYLETGTFKPGYEVDLPIIESRLTSIEQREREFVFNSALCEVSFRHCAYELLGFDQRERWNVFEQYRDAASLYWGNLVEKGFARRLPSEEGGETFSIPLGEEWRAFNDREPYEGEEIARRMVINYQNENILHTDTLCACGLGLANVALEQGFSLRAANVLTGVVALLDRSKLNSFRRWAEVYVSIFRYCRAIGQVGFAALAAERAASLFSEGRSELEADLARGSAACEVFAPDGGIQPIAAPIKHFILRVPKPLSNSK